MSLAQVVQSVRHFRLSQISKEIRSLQRASISFSQRNLRESYKFADEPSHERFIKQDDGEVYDPHIPRYTDLNEEVLLTTRDAVHGRVIIEELGVVVGTSARSANIFHDLYSRFRSLLGGSLTSYRHLFASATAEATANAVREAEKLGASSIIRLRYQNSSTDNRISGITCFIICYGTAVRCVPIHPNPNPRIGGKAKVVLK
eukprot:Clim_evm74s156 gene=Clim_evmTU74s156